MLAAVWRMGHKGGVRWELKDYYPSHAVRCGLGFPRHVKRWRNRISPTGQDDLRAYPETNCRIEKGRSQV